MHPKTARTLWHERVPGGATLAVGAALAAALLFLGIGQMIEVVTWRRMFDAMTRIVGDCRAAVRP